MSRELKTATPDASFDWASAYLFGADSQSASTPSIYAASTILASVKSIGFAADSTYDIGSDSVRPATVYADTIDAPTINGPVTVNFSGVSQTLTFSTGGFPTIQSNTGLYLRGTDTVSTTVAVTNNRFHLIQNSLVWSSTNVNSNELTLNMDSAGELAVRHGTNTSPAAVHVYNTDDGAGNYERGAIKWDSNVLEIASEAGGTGTARAMSISATALTLPNIPTSDPAVAGQIWSDSGTLKISAG